MIINFTQRWNEKSRAVFITPKQTFNPRLHEVSSISEKAAKDFIVSRHYSGSLPATRRRFGLFRRGRLVGVAIFSVSMNNRTLINAFGGKPNESLEYGRLCISDEIEFNAESWFSSQCFAALKKEGFRGVVTFADDLPRTTINGEPVHAGHLGVVYMSLNFIYTGRGERTKIYLLPDGKVFSKRALSKIRNGEQGHDYASNILVSYGASLPPVEAEARRAWLENWLPKLTRKTVHLGNHRYLYPFQKGLNLPRGLPFPRIKQSDLQLPLL